MSRVKFVFLSCILLMTVACNSQLKSQSDSTEMGVYPYPMSYPIATYTPVPDIFEEGYPGPQSSTQPIPTSSIPFSLPTPKSNTGVVTGQLLTEAEKMPFLGALYLATTIKADQEGVPPVISLDDSNPMAIQDTDGRFYFADIQPGTYALAIWDPLVSIIIKDPKNPDLHFVFEVKAGEVTDLDIIYIK